MIFYAVNAHLQKNTTRLGDLRNKAFKLLGEPE